MRQPYRATPVNVAGLVSPQAVRERPRMRQRCRCVTPLFTPPTPKSVAPDLGPCTSQPTLHPDMPRRGRGHSLGPPMRRTIRCLL